MQARVEVDKCQILTLLGGEGFCRATHAGHPIQLFIRASQEEARMNVPGLSRLRSKTAATPAGVPLRA